MTNVERASYGEVDALLQSQGVSASINTCLQSLGDGVMRSTAPEIKLALLSAFAAESWAINTRVTPSYRISVNAYRDKVAVQVQFGNIARAFYDLLKLDSMHRQKKIVAAVLVLPTNLTARRLGQNLANYERISSEMELYKATIQLPLCIIGIGR